MKKRRFSSMPKTRAGSEKTFVPLNASIEELAKELRKIAKIL
jgi:hypothetical protein